MVSQSLLPAVVSSSIGIQTVSDHAPSLIDLQLDKSRTRSWTWKFNESLVQEGPLRKDFSLALTRTFIDNDIEYISPFTVWETHKCVMRGLLIQKATELWKNRQVALQTQLNLVANQESKHKKLLSYSVAVDLRVEREKLASLLGHNTKIQILRARNIQYEHGNKSGKLLAH